jgi:SAM-dependent methyltransferase
MSVQRDLHEQNRRSWNHATRAHNSHKLDQAGFLRNGGSTLHPEELELLGDLRGKRLVHLQCNSGQDSLSLAARGADVTGVDISDEAVSFARQLSEESGVSARFERADVYDWLEAAAKAGEHFDLAFSSYGAIVWLSDLRTWARGIAGVLRPGGRFVLVEFHPVPWMLDLEGEGKVTYPYSTAGTPLTWEDGVGDYVGASGAALAPSGYQEGEAKFENPEPVHEFGWGLGDVIGAVLEAGLALEAFREFPYTNGCKMFPAMRELPGRRMVMPEGFPTIPLMYSLAARKD